MSNASEMIGSGIIATTNLYNAFSTAGYTALGSVSSNVLAKTSTSGALTANTLAVLINESGSAGYISQLSIFTNDATSRTLRVVITIDGVVRYDITSAAITATSNGVVLAGTYNGATPVSLPSIFYTNSIKVEYASSVTETAKFTFSLARNEVQ